MNKFVRLARYDLPLHFILFFTNWLPDNVIFLRLRGFLISPFFKKCGANLRVGRGNVFSESFNIELGNDIYIAYGNWFCGSTTITIEDEVMFGPKSIIVSSNHLRVNGSFRFGKDSYAPIKIGFGSWIGGNCSILMGADIGKGSVIAANTVVRDLVPDNSLFAGNPGKLIKTLND